MLEMLLNIDISCGSFVLFGENQLLQMLQRFQSVANVAGY